MNPEQNTKPPSHHQTAHQLIDDSHLSFIRKMVFRRVPQAIGLYLAGSWTFLEFFESLISRYNLSPHWQDVSLLVILLLFPTILILAYRHGAPGAQNWTYVEKMGIPTNIIITMVILFTQFASKDLGTSAQTVQGLGPDGSMMVIERPKNKFRKRLAVTFFEIDDPSVSDEYLALGIPLAIKLDLQQDPYLNVYDASDLAYEIKQSNYRGLTVPMALMMKIAQNNRIEYLILGKLLMVKERVILHADLYHVAKGQLVKKLKTTDHNDLFTAIDDISVQIKSAMGFSGGHINNSPDLPISEQLTGSKEAYIAFVKSQHEVAFKDDYTTAEKELQKAIALDDSFAVAASRYAMLLFRQTRTEEGLKMVQLAQQHNYRLTDSNKFSLATIGTLFSAEPDAAREIVQQWLALYPDDADAWSMKFSLHRNFDERLEAIAALREIIRLEPFGTHRHLMIGKIYASLGDFESALKEYEIFTAKNPTNASGHILIGDSNRTLGQFDAAQNQYQKAKLLLTNDLSADRKLADLLIRKGDFSEAEKQMKAYIKSTNIKQDEYRTWQQIADFYWLRGQRKEALSAFRNSFDALKTFTPETVYLLTRMHESWKFAAAGAPDEGQQLIDDAKMLLKASKGQLYASNINIAQAMFDAQTGNTERSMDLIDNVAKSLSNFIGSGIDDEISMFRGVVYYKSGNYQQSVESLGQFLKSNPTDETQMMSLMADSLLKIHQVDSAKNTFEKILREFPSHPLANLGMAKIAISQEEPSYAKTYLEKALSGWETADETFEPAEEARKIYDNLESI
ncbi:MAG: hypothetical protein DRQ47_01970 [Gammaproteobacteria bacterium]|nr:MAG: hypothetical protein DRQ47_01970 [Gammaproteobacteria bacterium]